MQIAIIGAGASGLTVAKALREVGLTPIVFEQSNEVGGLWVYYDDGSHTGVSYRSLRTNTSKQVTSFSDLPFPDDVPDFPSRAVVEDYLAQYAGKFDLLSLVRFGARVTSLQPAGNNQWKLTVVRRNGATTELFDAVLVCSGIFRRPALPLNLNLETFTGLTMHSSDYRIPQAFAGQSVVVVGLGSSAVDIAADLTEYAEHVTLSTRRGAWIAPRMVGGHPLDHRGTRLSLLLPLSLRSRRRHELLLREYARRQLDSPATVWKRASVPFISETAPSVTSDDLLPHITAGTITVRPQIEHLTSRDVVFDDGSRVQADAIIYCTGYELDFPFLPPELRPWEEPARGLYRLVFPANCSNLAFIGVCRVHGPILPIVEMQARLAARVLTGEASLPPSAARRSEILRRWSIQTARSDSPIRVSLIPYLDELGKLIGARPQFWRHPGLLLNLLTGPPVAAQYRLNGPDAWAGARELIAASGALNTRF